MLLFSDFVKTSFDKEMLDPFRVGLSNGCDILLAHSKRKIKAYVNLIPHLAILDQKYTRNSI